MIKRKNRLWVDTFLKLDNPPTPTHPRLHHRAFRSGRMFAGRRFTQNIQPAHGKTQNILPDHKINPKKLAHREPTSSHISSNYPPNFPEVAPSHAQVKGGKRLLYPEAVDMEGQVYVDGLKQLSPALTSGSSIQRYERSLLGGRSG